MILDLDFSVLEEHSLIMEQYLFLVIIKELPNNLAFQKQLKQYITTVTKGYLISEEGKKDLETRGFIEINNFEKGWRKYVLTPKSHSILFDNESNYFEVLREYPNIITGNDNTKFNGKTGSPQELLAEYLAIVKGSKTIHKQLIHAIRIGKAHNILKTGLLKFLQSRAYLNILDEYGQPSKEAGRTNFDFF